MLNWYPYGEHAAFYYGVQEGIFKKHGIDLTIKAGQGSTKTVQATGQGQMDFGWADTPAVLANVDKGRQGEKPRRLPADHSLRRAGLHRLGNQGGQPTSKARPSPRLPEMLPASPFRSS